MNEFMYTNEEIAWAYKPVGETNPAKVAEAERRFNELFERLEKRIEKDRLFPQTV